MASHIIDSAHAITMHSHTFIQPETNSSPAPSTAIRSSRRATSTSYELTEISTPNNDTHVRHPISHSHSSSSSDIESTLHHDPTTDPYQLASKLKPPNELNLIRADPYRRGSRKAKKIINFYESQNDNIERWLRPVDEHIQIAKDFNNQNKLKFKIAVQGSFAANILLAGLQIFAAVSSGSLSLFTTMADAVFDPMSNITLIVCNRAVSKVDPRRFPSGKARIETAGNIVFCFLMTAVSFILIVLASMELAEGNPAPRSCIPVPDNNNCAPLSTKKFYLQSVIVISIAFFVKLALFCYCWSLRNVYSQIHILWADHRNDIIINGCGFFTSLGGSLLRWWIDPMGAIILSLLIATIWLRTAYAEFQLLIGVTADTSLQQWITYISMTHAPDMIRQLDTVRAYHSGPRIIVEVDVVMDAEETLKATHDVAEALQMKLESLPDVERAYVHIDFETSHKPEHFLKKEL
ncbi:MAG: hypothetical protein Q9194_001081 [Teloschistes cf. exilis]